MSLTTVIALGASGSVIVLLVIREFRRHQHAPDLAWKPTGIKPAFTGHDEAKGQSAAKRADREATAKRKLAVRRIPQPKKPENVAPLRRAK